MPYSDFRTAGRSFRPRSGPRSRARSCCRIWRCNCLVVPRPAPKPRHQGLSVADEPGHVAVEGAHGQVGRAVAVQVPDPRGDPVALHAEHGDLRARAAARAGRGAVPGPAAAPRRSPPPGRYSRRRSGRRVWQGLGGEARLQPYAPGREGPVSAANQYGFPSAQLRHRIGGPVAVQVRQHRRGVAGYERRLRCRR